MARTLARRVSPLAAVAFLALAAAVLPGCQSSKKQEVRDLRHGDAVERCRHLKRKPGESLEACARRITEERKPARRSGRRGSR